MPLVSTLRTILPTIWFIYALQAAAAIPSIYLQSDRVYDISGLLTYLSSTALSLYLPTIWARSSAASQGLSVPLWPGVTDFHPRQLILSGLTAIWAVRLGSFLLKRNIQTGGDSRFETIKTNPTRFAISFFAQATWVTLVSLPVLATNAIPAAFLPALSAGDYVGLAIWLCGFVLEASADRQKAVWAAAKERKKHSEDFISTGLWARSRHPNYVGETMLWSGIAVTAGVGGRLAGAVGGRFYGGAVVGAAMAAVSPAFTYFLLTKISGVALAERRYGKKYAGHKDYEEWTKNTPVFWPKLFQR